MSILLITVLLIKHLINKIFKRYKNNYIMIDLKKTPIFNFINPVFKKDEKNDINTPLVENNLKYSYKFYYILSIISFLFFFPLGILSIYYYYKAKKLYKIGLNEKANNLVYSSYLLSISSIVIGIIVYLYLYCSIKIDKI